MEAMVELGGGSRQGACARTGQGSEKNEMDGDECKKNAFHGSIILRELRCRIETESGTGFSLLGFRHA